jgi:hypothetical protein
MYLEIVKSHPSRDDLFIDEVIIPHNKIKKEFREKVNRILTKECKKYRVIHS